MGVNTCRRKRMRAERFVNFYHSKLKKFTFFDKVDSPSPLPGSSPSRPSPVCRVPICARDTQQSTRLKCSHHRTAPQATFSQVRPSLPRYRRMAQALAEVDPGNTTRPRLPADPQTSYTYTKTTPAPAPASFTQSQHWLDEDAYDHYGGDDEQEYDPDDTECDRSATPPPAQHPPNHQVPPHQRQPQPQVQPQATPAPSPFVAVATAAAAAAAAHVHFHSRVRITSGLRRSGGTTHALGDSSDSDSPSSSISAPLRFRSRDAMPRAPLTERVSRLATQALQRRRAVIAAARTSSSSSAVPRLRARDCGEYAPLIGAGGPVTYGAARCGISVTGNRHRANGVRDQSRGEDDCAFGEWPWRALNRHVSDLLLLVQWVHHDQFQWWRWQIESTLCCCCSDESEGE